MIVQEAADSPLSLASSTALLPNFRLEAKTLALVFGAVSWTVSSAIADRRRRAKWGRAFECSHSSSGRTGGQQDDCSTRMAGRVVERTI